MTAPKHLSPATRRWWQTVVEGYEQLEEHHLKLLTAACECWDRKELARECLAREGLTYVDRFGSPKPRPEVGIARDAAIVFARLVRELRLDIEPPESRPPGLEGR